MGNRSRSRMANLNPSLTGGDTVEEDIMVEMEVVETSLVEMVVVETSLVEMEVVETSLVEMEVGETKRQDHPGRLPTPRQFQFSESLVTVRSSSEYTGDCVESSQVS